MKFLSTILLVFCLSSNAQAKPVRIALLGDSIITFAKIEVELKRILPDSVVDNYGVPCNTPWDIKGRISIGHGNLSKKILDPSKYDVVVVLAGYNGIWRPKQSNIRGLQAVYNKLKQVNVKVIALTQPPCGGSREWNPSMQKNISELNEWIMNGPDNVDETIDLNNRLMDPQSSPDRPKLNPSYTKDGLHLNEEGGKQIALTLI